MSARPVSSRLGRRQSKCSPSPLTLTLMPPRALSRAALLAGTSALGLLMMAGGGAQARPLGGWAPAPSVAALAASQAASQQAQQAAVQASSALKRATQAIQAMQATQSAARAAAAAASHSTTLQVNVPNGLGPGGLQVGAGTWQGADAPTQSVANGQTNVGINQTAAQAILTWDTFNVGAQTTLTFDQHGNASWVALNRVIGNLGPSQILGNIKADGQVYVINQNGIIFGGASQINVGTLIASSANITDTQFLNTGIYSTQSGSTYLPSFTGAGGTIVVENGALIATNAPSSVTAGGGFVLMMGTEVDNAGMITTPKGQTELAAGDDFILRQGYGTTANQTSTTRGNEIAPVIYGGSSSGTIDNTGLIFSQQGDITLAGHAVIQDGILVSTTSVNQRGTIHLLNSASDTTGSVTLTGNAVTTILPETGSADTALNSQRDALIADSTTQNAARLGLTLGQFDDLSQLGDREDQSRIEIVSGNLVNFASGSLTLAQGGQVAVSAGNRVFAATGATIDVSGTTTAVLPMSSNNIEINVQGNELRDSPQNRDSGALINANVWIDARDLILVPAGTGGYATDRYYTPGGLLEVSGYLANTGHTIGEWTAVGGTITLAAPEVVAQTGSTFNISGGAVSYAGGTIETTKFVTADGQVVNVDDASGSILYTSIAGGFTRKNAHWNVSQTWTSPLSKGGISVRWEDGYIVGRDAGSLILSTPTSLFEGDIVADVITGSRQIGSRPSGVTDGYKYTQNTVPLQGTLAIGQYNASGLANAYATAVVIGSGGTSVADSLAATDPLPSGANTAYFDAGLLNSYGLGGFSAATKGSIDVDAPMDFAPGAQVKLIAPIVDIAADITAPSGSVTVTNILKPDQSIAASSVLTTAGGAVQLTLEAGATIDTRGVWTNGLLDPADLRGLAFVNGGNVTFDSTQGVTLAAGSAIDVSSGGAILANGKTKGGKGGNVRLVANDVASGNVSSAALVLDATIRAVGAGGGGAFTIVASSVLIGDNVSATLPGQLVLPSSFFAKGFSNYDITGANGVTVAAGTKIDVVEPVYQFTAQSFDVRTGGDPAAALTEWTPPLYLEDPIKAQLTQRAGASLTLRATGPVGLVDGILVDQGAVVNVDPGQTVHLETANQITVNGTISAPGGTIALINDQTSSYTADPVALVPGLSIWIGDDAVLDVAARAYTATDSQGRSYGVVPDGGSITIGTDQGLGAASNAFIVIRPGAVLDASGASAMIDPGAGGAANSLSGQGGSGAIAVASNGGSIALASHNGIYLDGTLRANAGGAGASGGALAVTLGTTPPPVNNGGTVTPRPDAERVARVITIGQDYTSSGLPDDLAPGEAVPTLAVGNARLSADRIEAGGFDTISLYARDIFKFDGPVTLSAGRSISLYRGILSSGDAASAVTLNAPYVLLNGYDLNKDSDSYINNGTSAPSTQVSSATFTVNADLIDFQNDINFGVHAGITLTDGSTATVDAAGFANVNFNSQSDIRFGNTSMSTPGNLTFNAAQLYPLTGAVGSADAGGTLTIGRIGGDVPQLPYSVFGSLALSGAIVDQGGIVRAPLGLVSLGENTGVVNLLPGSITSASAAGLMIPYGGTTDGVSYTYNGADAFSTSNGIFVPGVTLRGQAVHVEHGAVLDLSGGGNLTGSGFISGRGGSVDVLATALANANPANGFSAAGNTVYAIVPSYRGAYAPVDAAAGTAPGIGQQITIPAGVPGLPAGTYTLLPARYALLPGAFRVEIGGASTAQFSGAAPVGNGSYVINGYQGVANTGIRNALPTEIIVTSGAAVRTLSQYNETSYSDFAIAKAQTLGQAPQILPADAKTLQLVLSPGADADFTFDGTALFTPAEGGRGGTASVQVPSDYPTGIEIVDTTPTAGFSGVSLRAEDLDAIGASRLVIGGSTRYGDVSPMTVQFTATATSVVVRDGAYLSAAEVFLVAGTPTGAAPAPITVEAGAQIVTLGHGDAPYDSNDGYIYDANGRTVVAVSNGWLNFLPPKTGGPVYSDFSGLISIGACPSGSCSGDTQLLADGTITFATAGGVQLGDNVHYGARYLTLAVPSINIGTDAALASATVPDGLLFNQDILTQLLNGNDALGVPKLERLTLAASQSINFYGSVDLDTIDPSTGQSYLQQLVFNTPAVYGYGSAGDTATLTTGTLVWNGVITGSGTLASALPGPVIQNGPGSGSGTLNIVADRIVFGYSDTDQARNNVTLDRLLVGFANVNLSASDRITANAKGSLSVYQSQGDYVQGSGYAYSGGNLNLVTPLLTGEAGSVNAITAGGALTISAPAGSTPDTVGGDSLGAELDLSAASITQGGTIALPSGRLTMQATGDILLTSESRIDLAGRAVAFFDTTKYSWGGDVVLTSTAGNVTQQAGAQIDISAANNNAGTLTVEALGAGAGQVSLAGLVKGDSTGSYDAGGGAIVPYDMGGIDIRAQTIADFSDLNLGLNASGVTGSRSFDIKQGDLVVGDEVKAHAVTISVDGGSLTVNGTIDASGAEVGSIRLAARDDVTLASGSKLDAHGTVLRVDTNGDPIDASNRAVVELTTSQGWLRLDPGATIDVRSADPVARGTIDLNAPRLVSASAGDIAISAGGPLTIQGAASIAVNGFWTYTDAPSDPNPTATGRPNQIITQAYLDQIDSQDSVPFIDNALANSGLMDRLAGLTSSSDAFHLRPGVEIRSATANGDLTVQGDLDFSGYRYGPNADRDPNSPTYGAGEPGSLVIRAGGDLNIYGSITDGFGKPVATPDDNGWILIPPATQNLYSFPFGPAGEPFGFDTVVPLSVTLAAGTTFGSKTLNFAVPLQSGDLKANAVIPTDVTLSAPYVVSSAWVATAVIQTSDGRTFAKGETIPAGTSLPAGTTLAAGTVLPGQVSIAAMTWPAGVPLTAFFTTPTLASDAPIPAGSVIPGGTLVTGFVTVDENGDPVTMLGLPSRQIGSTGTQGQNWAVAPMLAPGSLSWSIRLVAGADLGSADTRGLQSKSALIAAGNSGNLILGDTHYNVQLGDYSAFDCNPGIDSCGAPSDYPNFYSDYFAMPDFSVIRTGTGDLDLLAGGSFAQHSLYGIYTAGTQAAAVAPQYELPRGNSVTLAGYDGTVLGLMYSEPGTPGQYYGSVLADYQAYYPEHGGNVLLSVQGDITGQILDDTFLGGNVGITEIPRSNAVGNWLWRQGGDVVGQPAAWWINFGTYVQPVTAGGSNSFYAPPVLVGFTGIGALGGGNVTIAAGGNVGSVGNGRMVSNALDVAVASTGRVTSVTSDGNTITGGTMDVTGGGDISIKIAGALNPYMGQGTAGFPDDMNGTLTDLRGNIGISAASVGQTTLSYGLFSQADPRAPDPLVANSAISIGGPIIIVGDGTATLSTRGDLVLGGTGDAGRLLMQNTTPFDYTGLDGTQISQDTGGRTWFTLWTKTSAVNLFSAGGNLTPTTQPINGGGNDTATDGVFVAPPTLRAIAPGGSIYYGQTNADGSGTTGTIELAPSPVGQLEFLAGQSIYASGVAIDMSGADASVNGLPNPYRPAFMATAIDGSASYSNANASVIGSNTTPTFGSLFLFEADTPVSDLHAGDQEPIRFYATGGDIVSLKTGDVTTLLGVAQTTRYRAAKAIQVEAGRDLVSPSGVILQDDATDISTVSAGRDIFYANFTIAGPGLLQVTAGRNLYQADKGILHSIGQIVGVDTNNLNSGAGIFAMAGAGPNGPDWTDFAKLYLDPANQLAAGTPLEGSGKVVKTYGDELYDWLRQNFSPDQHFAYDGQSFAFTGSKADALAFFLTLPAAQQGVFVRQVYYAELTAGGREYNDPSSPRYGSYLRGREAIATLFPSQNANGAPLSYSGDITMFGGSGIHTDFGGAIQTLSPGGATLIGVEGQTPPSTAGLITQGSGDIQMYSLDSILLGQSRIMTTYGGDIIAWSAEGDINAGRGSKTTVLYTPPRRVYDNYGNVTLSPQVPSTGAGIATLNPISEVAPGNIDLIAPLGTIDAGEAGIRVSGNVNLAALQVVNAGNIQAQGTSTGIPTVQPPNVAGALTSSNTAGAAAQQAATPQQGAGNGQPSIIIVEILGFGGDSGGDVQPHEQDQRRERPDQRSYNTHSRLQVIGLGNLTDEQKQQLSEDERRNLTGR